MDNNLKFNLVLPKTLNFRSKSQILSVIDNQKGHNNRYISKEDYKKKLEIEQFPKIKNSPIPDEKLSNSLLGNNSLFSQHSFLLTNNHFTNRSSRKTVSDSNLNTTFASRNTIDNYKAMTLTKAISTMNSKFFDHSKLNNYNTKDIDDLYRCYYVSGDNEESYHKTKFDSTQRADLFGKYKIQADVDLGMKRMCSEIMKNEKNEMTNKPTTYIHQEYFKDPKKALKKISINKQIHDNINNIIINQLANKYVEKFNMDKTYKIKLVKMPKVKVSLSCMKNIEYNLNISNESDNEKKEIKQFNEEISEPFGKNSNYSNNILSREEFLKSLELQGIVFSYQNNKPISRVQTVITLVGNYLFMFGGLTSIRIDDLWRCDIRDSYSWKHLKPISKETPIGRSGHSLVNYQKKLFIFGGKIFSQLGTLNSNVANIQDLVIYDINKNYYSFEKIVNNEVKFRRNHIAEIIGSYMFIFGGIDDRENKFLSDFWILDLDKFRWLPLETRGNLPPPLAYHCSTLVLSNEKKTNPNINIYKLPEALYKVTPSKFKNEGIYIFGGMDDEGKLRDELRMLKIGKRPLEWRIVNTNGNIPEGRLFASINFYEDLNVLFLLGGKTQNDEFSSTLFLLDLETFCWSKVLIFDRSPHERAEHSSCIYGSSLIIFGGINSEKYIGSDIYVINLDIWEKKRRRLAIREKAKRLNL